MSVLETRRRTLSHREGDGNEATGKVNLPHAPWLAFPWTSPPLLTSTYRFSRLLTRFSKSSSSLFSSSVLSFSPEMSPPQPSSAAPAEDDGSMVVASRGGCVGERGATREPLDGSSSPVLRWDDDAAGGGLGRGRSDIGSGLRGRVLGRGEGEVDVGKAAWTPSFTSGAGRQATKTPASPAIHRDPKSKFGIAAAEGGSGRL